MAHINYTDPGLTLLEGVARLWVGVRLGHEHLRL